MRINQAAKAVEKQLLRDDAELRGSGNLRTRKTLTAEVQERTDLNVAVIRKEKTRAHDEFARRYENATGEALPPEAEPRIVSRFVAVTYIAAGAVALLDAVVSAIIGAATFNIGLTAAAGAGALLAVVLTVIFKGVCGHLASRFQDRPKKALQVLDRALVIVAVPWTACFFGALFLGRFASGGAWSDTLFNILVTALAVLSPLLSALLLVCAGVRGWDRGPVRLYHRLEKIERDLAELQTRCRARPGEEGPAPAAPTAPTSADAPPSSRAAAALLFGLMLIPALRAQPLGQIWVDGSPSPEAAGIARALDSSLALLPQIAQVTQVREVEVYAFAGDSFDAAPVGKPIQIPRFTPPDCTAARQRSERTRIFKAPDQDRDCSQKTDEARKQHDSGVADEIRRARDELARYAPSMPNRTCIVDLLARLGMPASRPIRFAVVITDGIETCEPRARQALAPPPGAIDVVLVIVPDGKKQSSGLSNYRRFEELKALWERRAPWLKAVVPRASLSAELFGRDTPASQK